MPGKHTERTFEDAQEGSGPVAISDDAEIVGFFIGRDEHEALFGVAVRDLLSGRETGATVSHDDARARVRSAISRRARR